ncbi:MAG TPA: PKD domain-containing protein [Planctomycetota bacterium]
MKLVIGILAGVLACSGETPPGTAAMTSASRVSGAAPLTVFFDAVDTADPAWRSGVIQPDDGDTSSSEYAWDFGDPKSGAWANSGRPRNVAFGPVAAHVFQAPGLYTVALTVTDRGGKRRAFNQKIQVLPLEVPTFHVSSTAGDDRADGRTPAAPWRSLDRARPILEKGGRLLLKRGDTFVLAGSPLKLAGDGPGHVGAYGPGAPPVVKVEGRDGGLAVFGDDWRITDLAFVGPGETDTQGAVLFDVQHPIRHTLIQRVTVRDFRVGLGWGDHTPMYATPHDGNTIADCEVSNAFVNGLYVGGRRLALLGNLVRDIRTSHVTRVWQAHKGVIEHNAFQNPGPERHALKLHGPTHGDGRPPTQHVVVSDNLFVGKTWSLSFGPQNPVSDERVSHVLFERNRTRSQETVQVDLHLAARNVTVRNNVFSGTGSAKYYNAVEVARRGVEPEPADIRILHNTVLKADAGQEFSVCLATSKAPGLEVVNNLAWAPNAQRRVVVSGGGEILQEGNLLADAPAFLDDGRGTLKPTAAAARKGVPQARARADFAGTPRPRSGACALGAFEP